MPVPQFTSLYWPNAFSPHKRCVVKYIDTLSGKKCMVKPLPAKKPTLDQALCNVYFHFNKYATVLTFRMASWLPGNGSRNRRRLTHLHLKTPVHSNRTLQIGLVCLFSCRWKLGSRCRLCCKSTHLARYTNLILFQNTFLDRCWRGQEAETLYENFLPTYVNSI